MSKNVLQSKTLIVELPSIWKQHESTWNIFTFRCGKHAHMV